MKKNKNIKKLLSVGTLVSIGCPVLSIVSCSNFNFDNLDYDFGIAIPPISSLNYVKYSNTKKILPTLIQGLIQDGPSADLKNQLQLPEFKFSERKANDVKGGELYSFTGETGSGIYPLSDFSQFAGNVKSGSKGLSYVNASNGGTEFITISLNGVQSFKGQQSKFSRKIVAQDYIDYSKYVLDLNVGSPYLINFEESKIIGVEDILNAQRRYARKFGDSYKQPFGKEEYKEEKGVRKAFPVVNISSQSSYADFDLTKLGQGWNSQNTGDEKYVLDIKKAALKFMLEGARISSSSINGPNEDPKKDFSTTDMYLHFENQPLPPITLIHSFLAANFLPINKEFVDSIGGIEKFGTSFYNWEYSSPFNIKDIRLGQGGYIDLEKDNFWPTKKYTISNKIKVYFNDDPNILSTMFEDKYISNTKIPAVFQSKFWADPHSRQFMKKHNGFGTQALQFNLDKVTNGNSPLQNENFRNAIAHSIDRAKLLKLLNWDSSFPVTTWTPLGGTIKTPDGRIIDDFLSFSKMSGPHRNKPYSLSTTPWALHTATKYKFEQAERKDNRFNDEEAWAYYQDYIKETGNNSKHTLTFLAADPTNINAALGISSMLKKSLHGKVNIKVKIVPNNSYETMRVTGKFDMTTFNFDQYGQSVDSYIKHLITKIDEIDYKKNKKDGFIDNPTGSWTLHDWYLKHKDEIAKYEKYFFIPSKSSSSIERKTWDILLDILKMDPRNNSDLTKLREKFQKIINREDDDINSYNNLFVFVTQIEKIIAASSPIVPLLDVDNFWEISRLGGATNTYNYSLQYAYDVLNKPISTLPGKESLLNE